jgi:NAD(P)-dependent dehydrogenase (short-subunit alcohol dehydrogenase family)
VAVITGAASGIGFATARRFICEGARVAAVDIDGSALAAAFAGRNVHSTVADVADRTAMEEAFSRIESELGKIDVAFANAGISIRRAFTGISAEEWRRTQAVNLDGVFHTAQLAALHMVESGGVILLMGSTNGLSAHSYYAAYNASKAGVISLARSMAVELAPRIRVNAICPGYVLTPMQKAEYSEAMIEAVNNGIPLRRHAQPEEIAALAAFLASDDARYITGQPIAIDGGKTA